MSSIRLANDDVRGRLAIAGHLPAIEAHRSARRLAAERNLLGNVWGMVLEACGAESDAASQFTRADAAAKAGMRSTEAIARWRAATCAPTRMRRPVPSGPCASSAFATWCDLIAPIGR